MTDARDTEHPARLGERVTWLALVVAIVGLLQAGTPARVTVLSLIVVVVTLAASLRWRLGWAAILVLLAVGVALRLAPATGFSDVLVVSQAAGRELLAGGNPYGHGFVESTPPGAPFAYGPLALLWYLPSLDRPASLELLASLVVLGLLAVRGRPLGLAVYAVTPAFVVAATDGSNDTTAGLLILVALLAALRWPVAGAVLLALATAFKPYALAWLPGPDRLRGLDRAPGGIPRGVRGGLAAPPSWPGARAPCCGPSSAPTPSTLQPYYSLAYGLGSPADIPKAAWQGLRVGVGLLLAALALRLTRGAASLVIVGAVIFGATLFLGYWSTFAYLAAVAPILCWNLDDWLGLGAARIAWPGDPVGALSRWVDARWPVRRPGGRMA